MINIIFGIVIIIALILGVYIFGIYTANRGNKNIDIEITIFYYVVLSFILYLDLCFYLNVSDLNKKKLEFQLLLRLFLLVFFVQIKLLLK